MDKDNGKRLKKTNSSKIIAIVGVAVIVVLVYVIVVLLQREPVKEKVYVEPTTGGRGTVVTEDNIKEVLEELNKPIEDASYTVQMTTNWNFPSANETSPNSYVANSTINDRTVYFDVVLKDTNELVYSSPYLPVGSHITGFALDSDLEKGEYQAVVIYHLVDDDFNELTTASITVTLNIES